MMRMSIALTFPVALVVFTVRACPKDGHDSSAISNRHLEPVSVAFDVEDHHAVREEAGASVLATDIARPRPGGELDIREPALDPCPRVRVLAAKPLEQFPADDPHWRSGNASPCRPYQLVPNLGTRTPMGIRRHRNTKTRRKKRSRPKTAS